MFGSKINDALKNRSQASQILKKAGSSILKSSLHTAKQVAALCRNEHTQNIDVNKTAVKKSAKLLVKNQIEVLKVSKNAIKEVYGSFQNKNAE